MGDAQTGDERNKSYDAAIEAYKKGLEIKPNDAGVYNQMGNLYGKQKKIPEATEALNKAAQLDPTMAAKAYYNMGANMVNTGSPDKASEFFKKATDADPNYARSLVSIRQPADDAREDRSEDRRANLSARDEYRVKEVHGTAADRPARAGSRGDAASHGEKVETKIHNPDATTPAKKKK